MSIFQLGKVVATPGAIEALDAVGGKWIEYVRRHHAGDWGELTKDDADINNQGVLHCSRILSAYSLSNGVKIWIITDDGHEVTTILLPSEY